MRRDRCLATGLVLLAALATSRVARAGDDTATPFGTSRSPAVDPTSWEGQIAQRRALRLAQASGPAPAPATTPAPAAVPAAIPTAPPTPAPTPPAVAPSTAPAPGGMALAPAPAFNAAGSPASNLFSSVTDVASVAAETTFVPPIMIGDQAPFTAPVPQGPPLANPARPPIPGLPGSRLSSRHSASLAPWIRGFKMAEDQSPRPQDRFFFNFNYYNNLNYETNARLNSPIRNLQAYREIFGYEKTFFDGNASLGLRLPIDSLTGTSSIKGLGTGSTSVGSLMVFSKFILWQDPRKRNLLSGGLALSAPTAPTSFAGANHNVFGFRDVQLQPYLGYIWSKDRFYVQGFEEIEVPTDPHDVTMLYNDVGMGYYLYTAADKNAWLKAIVPAFETHVNIPLNHQGALRFNDPAGTASVVDLTFGLNFLLGPRSILSVAFVDPVTGPRPFNYEWNIAINVFFGKGKTSYRLLPPIAGD